MDTDKKPSSVQKQEANDFCFTIMPFGGWFDSYYKDIYCPAITEAGLDHKRADDLYRPSTIVNDIWSYTKECKLVLADLTGKNPNVLYELGLAHAIAKPVIIVTESLDDIPFDLRALRVIEYDKNAHNWGEVLKGKVTKAIKEVVASPLKAVLPTFLDVEPSQPRKISAKDKEIIELTQEMDALRREVVSMRRSHRSRDINADVAYSLIEDAIRKKPNISMHELVSMISPMGPPASWIIDTAKDVRKKLDDEVPF